MNLNVTLTRRIIKNDIKLLLYNMRKQQYVTPVQKQKILDIANILLRDLKVGTAKQEIVFFKQLFTIEASVKHQNDRVYAKFSAIIDESVRTVYR